MATKNNRHESLPSNNEFDNIPLADDDTVKEITDNDLLKLNLANITGPEKLLHIQQQAQNRRRNSETNLIRSDDSIGYIQSPQPNSLDINLGINSDEMEEKERMIQQVLELQNTLDDLSLRVESVKEENLKLKSENQVLGQYIENLVSASSVFQSTSPKSRKNDIIMKT